jgi:hypothetical protein
VDQNGSFVPAFGIADYAAIHVDDQRLEVDMDLEGRFSFTYTFQHPPAEEGRQIRMRADIFRQQRYRDFMQIQGEWLANENPEEELDVHVAGTSLSFRVYELTVALALPAGRDEYVADTGVLRLHWPDATIVPVFRARDGMPGFTFERSEDGQARVIFRPTGSECSPYGRTRAELTIYDTAGRRHVFEEEFETP